MQQHHVTGRNDSLGWFLDRSVGAERPQLLLYALEGVSEVMVVECLDRNVDPRQEVRRQRLVLVDHLVILQAVVDHLRHVVAE